MNDCRSSALLNRATRGLYGFARYSCNLGVGRLYGYPDLASNFVIDKRSDCISSLSVRAFWDGNIDGHVLLGDVDRPVVVRDARGGGCGRPRGPADSPTP